MCYNLPMNKHSIYIGINGIYCEHCITTITNTLSNMPGVEDVNIRNNIAHVVGDKLPENEAFIKAIKEIGYETDTDRISTRRRDITPHIRFSDFIAILSILILIAYLCRRLFGFDIFIKVIDDDSYFHK